MDVCNYFSKTAQGCELQASFCIYTTELHEWRLLKNRERFKPASIVLAISPLCLYMHAERRTVQQDCTGNFVIATAKKTHMHVYTILWNFSKQPAAKIVVLYICNSGDEKLFVYIAARASPYLDQGAQ